MASIACDYLGFVACGLVLCTFAMSAMRPLRIVAMLSNASFIGYAWTMELWPILGLHAVLLPLNAGRLLQIEAARRCAGTAGRKPPASRPSAAHFLRRTRRANLRPVLGFDTRPSADRHPKEVQMFSHVMIGSNDLARSKAFYDALLAALGGKAGTQDPRGRLVYVHNGGRFLITTPIDGEAATHANGGTIGFAATGSAEADAWHKAGTANGGTAIEDPPGVRQGAAGELYLAYLRDPDGNKLCALHRMG